MKIRSTVILCVLAVLGVAAAIFAERYASRGADAAGRLEPLLAVGSLPADGVSRITLVRGEEAMEFVRGEDGWMQTKPFACPMDAFSMRQLPALATAVRVVDVLDPGEADARSRAALGLDPPRASVRFESPGGATTLVLGRRGIGGLAYAEIEGDAGVYVVTQELHERATDMDAREWRDRAIFRDVGVDSDRVVIETGGSVSELVREGKRWRMERPMRTRVNPAARDALMQALGRAQVAGFVLDQPSDKAQFGLDTPSGSVTVTTTRLRDRSGSVERALETQRLAIGARVGVGAQDRFGLIDGRDTVVRVSEPVLRALFLPAAQLVAITATGVVPADVKTIRIDGAAGAVGLTRDLDRWIAPDHDGSAVDATLVDELLAILTQVPAAEVALQEYPRERHVARITMFGYDGRPMDTVRVARETAAGGRWILENGDNVLRFHPAATALRLAPETYGLR